MLPLEHLQGGSPDLRDVRVGDGSSKRGDGGQLSPRLCSVGPHVTAKVVEAAGKSGNERLHLGGVDDEPREARCDVSLNVGVEGQGRVDRCHGGANGDGTDDACAAGEIGNGGGVTCPAEEDVEYVPVPSRVPALILAVADSSTAATKEATTAAGVTPGVVAFVFNRTSIAAPGSVIRTSARASSRVVYKKRASVHGRRSGRPKTLS